MTFNTHCSKCGSEEVETTFTCPICKKTIHYERDKINHCTTWTNTGVVMLTVHGIVCCKCQHAITELLRDTEKTLLAQLGELGLPTKAL